MVKIFKFFIYLLILVSAIIYFFPKVSGYYLLEKEMAKYKVVFSKEKAVDNGFSLDIKHANLSYQAIESASIKNINVKIFGLYNAIDVESVRLLDVASSFVPLKINNIHLSYTVINPLNIVGNAQGEFGVLHLTLHVVQRKLQVVLKPSKLMLSRYANTLRYMHKNSNGEYVYEQNIKL